MPIILDGTAGIANNATDISYTGTLTGSTGVVNIGSGQVYKDASGNVGIGTSSPGGRLDVNGDAVLRGNVGMTTAGFVYSYAGGVNGQVRSGFQFDGTNQQTLFFTAGTERARIDSSGAFLVNQSAQISGENARLQATGGTGTALGLKGGSNNYYAAFYNTSNAFSGSITGSSGTGVAYNTSSDYRLKNTIAPMTGALDKVALLNPCTYKWKVDGSDGQGFIAHELAEVVPGCVTGEKDAVDAEGKPQYQGIDTSFLVATLTAAIQELKAIIDTQATRITALEAK